MAARFRDMHVLDLHKREWTDLTAAIEGEIPPERFGHGFGFVDGHLYVFGGSVTESSRTDASGSPSFVVSVSVSVRCPEIRFPRGRVASGSA